MTNTATGIKIFEEDQFHFVPMKGDQLNRFVTLLTSLNDEPVCKVSDEQIDENKRRVQSVLNQLISAPRIEDLSDTNQQTIAALVCLMEMPEIHLVGGNWLLHFIEHVMMDFIFKGRACIVNGPAVLLDDLADSVAMFWDWVRDGQTMVEVYPELFKTAEPAPAAPAKRSKPKLVKAAAKKSAQRRKEAA